METISGAGLTSSCDAGVTATSLGICDSRSRTSAGPDFGKKPGRRPKAISVQNKGEEDIWTLEFQGTFGHPEGLPQGKLRVIRFLFAYGIVPLKKIPCQEFDNPVAQSLSCCAVHASQIRFPSN